MKWFVLLFLVLFGSAAHAVDGIRAPTKVQLTVEADARIDESLFRTLEQTMVQFLNRMLESYGMAELTVRSQSLLDSALAIVLRLRATSTGTDTSPSDFADEVVTTFKSVELERLLSEEFGLAKVLSVEDICCNGFPTSSPSRQTIQPVLPTAPPSTKVPVLPMVSPNPPTTPQPTGKGQKVTPSKRLTTQSSVSPLPSQTLSLSKHPTIQPTISPAPTPSLTLCSKSYRTNATVKLFGLFGNIPDDEIEMVESITQAFIQESLTFLPYMILDICNVDFTNQTVSRSRRRRTQSDFLLVHFVVDGEGWSTSQQTLKDPPFDDLVQRGFVTREDDYFARLKSSTDTFQDLEIPGDEESPPVLSTTPSNDCEINCGPCSSDICSRSCSCGRPLCLSRFRESDDSKSDGDLENDEYLYDHDIPREIYPTERYPIQQSRNLTPLSEGPGELRSSLQSPSLLGDSDIENWSIASVSV